MAPKENSVPTTEFDSLTHSVVRVHKSHIEVGSSPFWFYSKLSRINFSVVKNKRSRMAACVVVLQNNKLISLKEVWVQFPVPNAKSIVFFSPNHDDAANFHLEPSYYFDPERPSCYKSRVVERFGKCLPDIDNHSVIISKELNLQCLISIRRCR